MNAMEMGGANGWGLTNRLGRIFDPATGGTVMLAADHGYFLGPTTGMERPGEALAPLLPHADALMVTRGLLRRTVRPPIHGGLVLRISGGPSVVGPDLADEVITTSIEEALRLDAAAVAVSVFVGSSFERQTLANLATTVDRAAQSDLPVLAVTAVGKELGNQDLRYLSLATRICAELGATMVKTYHAPGFEELVASAMVPVVIAGGKRLDTVRDALEMAHAAIAAGAAGVDFGRNVWQSSHPVAMIRALRAIVHDGSGVEEALALHGELAEDRP
jgi:putative autoinducer-2 (AI-2) aldolase